MRHAYIYIIILAVSLMVGCSTPQYKAMSQSFRLGVPIRQTTNQVQYVELSAERVETFISSQGVDTKLRNTSDKYFCAVSEEWFTTTVLPEYWQFLKDLELQNRYEDEKNDCDDYTRAFTFFCKMKARRTMDMRYNMAVADVFYYVGGNKKNPHAINGIIVMTKEGNLKLIYVEPQTAGKFPEPSVDISKNVYFWSM